MSTPLPRLREAVSIRPFDAANGAPRHVVAIDDRHFVVGEAIAALLREMRGRCTSDSLAERLSQLTGRSIGAATIEQLLRETIPPVVFEAQAARPEDRPLQLRWRFLSAARLSPLLRFGSRLIAPLPAAVVALLFAIVDALVIAQTWPLTLTSAPNASMAGVLIGTLLGVFVHELGHLSACRRYGGSPGGIGIGLYWLLPVLYSEVHGAWLLQRRQRAVVDLAGVYFQCLWLTGIGVAQLLRPSATLLMILWWSHLLLFNTLNPVLKFDGYWLLSDLTGSYNLHRRIRDQARRCCRALTTGRTADWPPRKELALLAGFGALACAYFGYLLFFMAHNLALAASNLILALSKSSNGNVWGFAAQSLWLGLLAVGSCGLAAMLARAVCKACMQGHAE